MERYIHHTARTQYHNIPSWDFYRSLVSLLTITAPDVASDLALSLVNDAQQDPGGGMPRWVLAATDSCGMFGDGSSKVLATAYAFGARDFDAPGALSAMIRAATQPGTTSAGCPVREGLEDYLTLGYVSTSIGDPRLAPWSMPPVTFQFLSSPKPWVIVRLTRPSLDAPRAGGTYCTTATSCHGFRMAASSPISVPTAA